MRQEPRIHDHTCFTYVCGSRIRRTLNISAKSWFYEGQSTFFFENGGFTIVRAQFFGAETGGGPRRWNTLVLVLPHVHKRVPAPRGEFIFESGQRYLEVSSKAHKFACELGALLASDKHLGSAERSERQLPTPNTPASGRGTMADLLASPLAPTHLVLRS